MSGLTQRLATAWWMTGIRWSAFLNRAIPRRRRRIAEFKAHLRAYGEYRRDLVQDPAGIVIIPSEAELAFRIFCDDIDE